MCTRGTDSVYTVYALCSENFVCAGKYVVHCGLIKHTVS